MKEDTLSQPSAGSKRGVGGEGRLEMFSEGE